MSTRAPGLARSIERSAYRATRVNERMIIRARNVLPMDQPPIEDGAVVVEGTASWPSARPRKSARRIPVRCMTWRTRARAGFNQRPLPSGLHADARGSRMARQLTEWILQLVAAKQLHSEKEYVNGIPARTRYAGGLRDTTVINIESFPGCSTRFCRQNCGCIGAWNSST